ncbi:MAG: hypothetical protein Kow0069_09610 [Promethearchaeota archaeon]
MRHLRTKKRLGSLLALLAAACPLASFPVPWTSPEFERRVVDSPRALVPGELRPAQLSRTSGVVANFTTLELASSEPVRGTNLNASTDALQADVPAGWNATGVRVQVANLSGAPQVVQNGDFSTDSTGWTYSAHSVYNDTKTLNGSYDATSNAVAINVTRDEACTFQDNFTTSIGPQWSYFESGQQASVNGDWSDEKGRGAIRFSYDGTADATGNFQRAFRLDDEVTHPRLGVAWYTSSPTTDVRTRVIAKYQWYNASDGSWVDTWNGVIYNSVTPTEAWGWFFAETTGAFDQGPGEYRLLLRGRFVYTGPPARQAYIYFTDVNASWDMYHADVSAHWSQLVDLSAWKDATATGGVLRFNYSAPADFPSSPSATLSAWINDTRVDSLAFDQMQRDDNKHLVEIDLSPHAPLLEGVAANFSVGVYFQDDDFWPLVNRSVRFDDVVAILTFWSDSAAAVDLRARVVGDPAWEQVDDTNVAVLSGVWTGATLSVELWSSPAGLLVNLSATVRVERVTPGGASAKYFAPAPNASDVTWNVSFTTAPGMDALLAATDPYDCSTYNFTVLGLPALDGGGVATRDWWVRHAFSPLGADVNASILREAEVPTAQNVTAPSSAVADWVAEGKGTWWFNATQQNYLSAAWMEDAYHEPLQKCYYSNQTSHNATARDSVVPGNFRFSVTNASGVELAGWPKFELAVQGNASGSWVVDDSEPGDYYLVVEWNDTTTRTWRFGYLNYSFEVWRTTTAAVTFATNEVGPGEAAPFVLDYNATRPSPARLSGVNVKVYNNETGNEWGLDFLGTYQVYNFHQNANGSHGFTVGTLAVGAGNYTLKITCSKPFHDPQVLYQALNLSGFVLNYTFTDGVVEFGGKYYLSGDNVPAVNQTGFSSFTILVRDFITMEPLPDAAIVPKIGSRWMQWTELYKVSGDPQDLGLYEVQVDATGLHNDTTYNLTLLIQASNYNPNGTSVQFCPRKIPTDLVVQALPPTFEGGEVQAFATYRNVLVPGDERGLNGANVTWRVQNATSNQLLHGSMSPTFAGVYAATIPLAETPYLYPGQYVLNVTAELTDCEPATSTTSLVVLAKNASLLQLSVSSEVRVGFTCRTTATLTLSNGTGMTGKVVSLNATFGSGVSILKDLVTNASGAVEMEFSLEEGYDNVTVTATFAGTESVAGSSASTFRVVLPKYWTEVSVVTRPDELKAGEPSQFRFQLSVEGGTSANKQLEFACYVAGDQFPTYFEQGVTNGSGMAQFVLPPVDEDAGTCWINATFPGTDVHQASGISFPLQVIPRISAAISLKEPLESARAGSKLVFNGTLVLGSSDEPLQGKALSFSTFYDDETVAFFSGTTYADASGEFQVALPLLRENKSLLTMMLAFAGDARIAGAVYEHEVQVLPKLQTTIELLTFRSEAYDNERLLVEALLTTGGDPLKDKVVTLTIGALRFSSITDEDGVASFSVPLRELTGEHAVVVTFDGSVDVHASSEAAFTIRVASYAARVRTIVISSSSALGAMALSCLAVYRGLIRPRARRRQARFLSLNERFLDAENLQLLQVISSGGLDVFTHAVNPLPISPSMISGFITAVASFGSELPIRKKGKEGKKDDKAVSGSGDGRGPTGIEALSYQQFKIVVEEGRYVKVALLLAEMPSGKTKSNLVAFTRELELKFEDRLANFRGKRLEYDEVRPLLVKYLDAHLLEVHWLDRRKVETESFSRFETRVLEVAEAPPFGGEFRINALKNRLLSSSKGKDDLRLLEAMFSLLDREVFLRADPKVYELREKHRRVLGLLDSQERKLLKTIKDSNCSDDEKRGPISVAELSRTTAWDAKDVLMVVEYLSDLKLVTLKGRGASLTQEGEEVVAVLEHDKAPAIPTRIVRGVVKD